MSRLLALGALAALALASGCLAGADAPSESAAAPPPAPAAGVFQPREPLGQPTVEVEGAPAGPVRLRVALDHGADRVTQVLWTFTSPDGRVEHAVGWSVERTFLPPGAHRVHVSVRDAYDRAAEASLTLDAAPLSSSPAG